MDEFRQRVKEHAEQSVRYNDPHVSERFALRTGSRKLVEMHVKNPTCLSGFKKKAGKYGDVVYELYFDLGDKTMILPVIFRKKGLYIITFILRHRNWRNFI